MFVSSDGRFLHGELSQTMEEVEAVARSLELRLRGLIDVMKETQALVTRRPEALASTIAQLEAARRAAVETRLRVTHAGDSASEEADDWCVVVPIMRDLREGTRVALTEDQLIDAWNAAIDASFSETGGSTRRDFLRRVGF